MRTIRPATVVAASVRIYGLLLRLCPAEYRGQYGPEMAQAFQDLAREAYHRLSDWGVVAL